MPYVYEGTLTDLGLDALVGLSPQLRVRPQREAYGPDGELVSAAPVTVDVAASGAFSVSLAASTDLRPVTRYVIEVGRFEETFDGPRFLGVDTWVFPAAVGGGRITEQDSEAWPFAVFVGPPVADWPEGTPPGFYIQAVAPNAWGIKTGGN
ncbi:MULTISPECIES: hypothetical protein [unclassified Agrococcus]|uniref:hypothetical protein n=1 Tax=unclassified Agrococcus TaxID=2615065 RepID=UPI0036206613